MSCRINNEQNGMEILTQNRPDTYNTPFNKWGFIPMRDYIDPQGKCRFCGSRFQWNEKEDMFCCPVHFTVPKLYQVRVPFNGERIRRGTDWQGNTLRSHYEAQKLAEQAKKEIAAKTFDPDKWRSKKKIETKSWCSSGIASSLPRMWNPPPPRRSALRRRRSSSRIS